MSQLQPVWTSGDYCKVSFKSKDVALSLTNLCVHKTEIQLTTLGYHLGQLGDHLAPGCLLLDKGIIAHASSLRPPKSFLATFDLGTI